MGDSQQITVKLQNSIGFESLSHFPGSSEKPVKTFLQKFWVSDDGRKIYHSCIYCRRVLREPQNAPYNRPRDASQKTTQEFFRGAPVCVRSSVGEGRITQMPFSHRLLKSTERTVTKTLERAGYYLEINGRHVGFRKLQRIG